MRQQKAKELNCIDDKSAAQKQKSNKILIINFVSDQWMKRMNLLEKRDYIYSHLHQADEKIVDEFFEVLKKSEILKEKLASRAEKSEEDILADRVFTKEEVENKLSGLFRE